MLVQVDQHFFCEWDEGDVFWGGVHGSVGVLGGSLWIWGDFGVK